MHKLNPIPNFSVIGHRGVAGLRPENTYCSFKYAAELGLNWVEFDVQLSKDKQWVVMHDETIDRTTNGHGRIQDHTLAELKQLEAGLWFKPPYPSEPIPTLRDMILFCQSYGLHANIEIKGAETNYEEHAEYMYAFLKTHALLDQPPLLSSFDLPCIIMLRDLLPSLPIAYLVDYFATDTIEICSKHRFTSVNCDVQKFSSDNLRQATEEQLPVLLYTINDPTVARQWLDAGVSAVFSDRPDLLIKL